MVRTNQAAMGSCDIALHLLQCQPCLRAQWLHTGLAAYARHASLTAGLPQIERMPRAGMVAAALAVGTGALARTEAKVGTRAVAKMGARV